MKIPVHIREYESKLAPADHLLVTSDLGGIEQVVVIPALAE